MIFYSYNVFLTVKICNFDKNFAFMVINNPFKTIILLTEKIDK